MVSRCFFLLLLCLSWANLNVPSFAGCMDSDNSFWTGASEQITRDKLMQLMTCRLDSDTETAAQIDQVACNWFVAEGLKELYGVNDFSKGLNGHWLTANEIASYVRSHSDIWSSLGAANSQSVLQEAAQGAANGQPVIAVMAGDTHGHVAIILAGKLQSSSTWKDTTGYALKVPNSAAFSLNHIDKAYVGCRLSAAFSDPAQVEIFWRLK